MMYSDYQECLRCGEKFPKLYHGPCPKKYCSDKCKKKDKEKQRKKRRQAEKNGEPIPPIPPIPPCHRKTRFATEYEANRVLLECRMRRALRKKTHRREQRTYECEHCHGFHLTSQPRKGGR